LPMNVTLHMLQKQEKSTLSSDSTSTIISTYALSANGVTGFRSWPSEFCDCSIGSGRLDQNSNELGPNHIQY
jgi:hypothetical protein